LSDWVIERLSELPYAATGGGPWLERMSRPEELRERTKHFALRIIKLFRALRRSEEARILGRQLLRSGTSVAANYRALCRARSRAEFIAKMGVVIEEADEAVFWMELLVEAGLVEGARMQDLLREANDLVAIFVASRKTARSGTKVPNQVSSLNHKITQSRNAPDSRTR
jgi:four helix bundle protein